MAAPRAVPPRRAALPRAAAVAALAAALACAVQGCGQESDTPNVRHELVLAIPMENHDDYQYALKVHVGSPPQPFSLQIDTGSWKMFTMGYDSGPSANCTNETETLTFSSGSASGKVCHAQVGIGDSVVSDMRFLDVDQTNGNLFNGAPIHGLVGLGPPWARGAGVEPGLFGVMSSQGLVDGILGVYLTSGGRPGSMLSIGGINSSFVTGDIAYAPVNNTIYRRQMARLGVSEVPDAWSINIDAIHVGGGRLDVCGLADPCAAIVDTGASVCMLSHKVMSPIGLDQMQRVPCEQVPSLPNITITIAGREFAFDPAFYMRRVNDSRSQGQEVCEFSVAFVGDGQPQLLGVPFLRQYYTVFDARATHRRVGFAAQRA